MSQVLRLSGQREPLGLWRHRAGPPAEVPDLLCERIELSSRGDRVTGRLWAPRRKDGEAALVLVQHRAGASASDAEIAATAVRLAGLGAIAVAVDLPLHGSRRDAKLTQLLQRALAGDRDAAAAALLEEFERQAVVDLERALDALATFPEVDAERIGFVGYGLGAELGAAFSSLDLRVRAVALAFDAASASRRGFDPQPYIAAFAPRPLLQLRETRSAAEPSSGPDPDALAALIAFLASHLALHRP